MRHLRLTWFVFQRAWREMRARQRTLLWAMFAVMFSLFLFGASRLATRNVERWLGEWNSGSDMVVTLDDNMDHAHREALRSALQGLPVVQQATLVTPETAYGRLVGTLGTSHEFLKDTEPNILPYSIEVSLRAGVEDVASGHPLIEKLRTTHGVTSIDFLSDWSHHMADIISAARMVGRVVLGLVLALCVYFVMCAVRLSTPGRSRDARILASLGAPSSFDYGPALFLGTMLGLLGSVFAGLALGGAFGYYAQDITSWLRKQGLQQPAVFLPWSELLLLGLLGSSLGVVSGFLANRVRPKRVARVVALPLVALALFLPMGQVQSAQIKPEAYAQFSQELAVINRTQTLIQQKDVFRSSVISERLRSLYRSLRREQGALTFSPQARRNLLQTRLAAMAILQEDVAELAQLKVEDNLLAAQASELVQRIAGPAAWLSALTSGGDSPTGQWPVTQAIRVTPNKRAIDKRLEFVERGAFLLTKTGTELRAPISGAIAFVGAIRGTGPSLVIANETDLVVLGGVATTLAIGATVTQGAIVGDSLESYTYIEVRKKISGVWISVTPESLVAP